MENYKTKYKNWITTNENNTKNNNYEELKRDKLKM